MDDCVLDLNTESNKFVNQSKLKTSVNNLTHVSVPPLNWSEIFYIINIVIFNQGNISPRLSVTPIKSSPLIVALFDLMTDPRLSSKIYRNAQQIRHSSLHYKCSTIN